MKKLLKVASVALLICVATMFAACADVFALENFEATNFSVKNTEHLYDGTAKVFEVKYVGKSENLSYDVTYSLDKTTFVTAEELNLVGDFESAVSYDVYFKVEAEGFEDYISQNAVKLTIIPKAVELKVGSSYNYYNSIEEAVSFVSDSAEIKLYADVDVPTAVEIYKNITLNLNEKTISALTDTEGNGVFYVGNGGKLTINGNGEINGLGNNPYSMALWADGGEIVINGGHYTNVGASSLFDVEHFDLLYVKNGGVITINGGTFECETDKWVLNSNDTLTGTFVVNGGSFKGFDPSQADTEPGEIKNWVSEGYTVVESNGIYIVVAE